MALLNARRLLLERQRSMGAVEKREEDRAELDADSLFEFDKDGGWVKKGYESKKH